MNNTQEPLPSSGGGYPSELIAEVYESLRGLAHHQFQNLRPGQTITPTELVHEAFAKLSGANAHRWDNPGHFFTAAATAMRRILVDRARSRGRLKRGGNMGRVELDDVAVSDPMTYSPDEMDIQSIDSALDRLEQAHGNRYTTVVELRFFAGLSMEQIATALGVTRRTVDRDWSFARAWLLKDLGSRDGLEQSQS
jgi:RNA polymerase sigma factor (TIGR02999 family)